MGEAEGVVLAEAEAAQLARLVPAAPGGAPPLTPADFALVRLFAAESAGWAGAARSALRPRVCSVHIQSLNQEASVRSRGTGVSAGIGCDLIEAGLN